jgi:Fe2+ or Zn2+ uptake regulation protein
MKTEMKHRGRPRPEETIRRDERVLQILSQGALSRNRLWTRLKKEEPSVTQSQVWLSLDRLRSAGKVRLCQGIGERIWTTEQSCP